MQLELMPQEAPMPGHELDAILERSAHVLEGKQVPKRSQKFQTYAVTAFRGGIGKSTLAFNLAYEISRKNRLLLLDTCSQKNLSQAIFGEQLHDQPTDLYKALVAEITSTSGVAIEDLVVRANPYCQSFAGGAPLYMIPGSSELFLFPSLLYSQLAQFGQLRAAAAESSKRVLLTVDRIIANASAVSKPDKTLVDTSPFFGGATHLSWCAAEALIIPVRVDQNSVDALRLTLQMVRDKNMDFHRFNAQADLTHQPVVHAIVMTHCGWSRQKPNTPDSSTKFFVQKAIDIALEFTDLFSENDVSSCFYLLEDFHSSGRISGNQRIPLSKLTPGQKYLVDGQRLEVNPSVYRYKAEVSNLAAAL
jgi:chromosome partitioning protein